MLPFFGNLPSAGQVQLTAHVVQSHVTDPADAEAGLRVGSDGKIYQRTTSGGAYVLIAGNEWLDQAIDPGKYSCRVTVNSGSLTTGTAGSWLPLTADRDFTRTQTVVGQSIVDFTLEIGIGTSPIKSVAQQLDALVDT